MVVYIVLQVCSKKYKIEHTVDIAVKTAYNV